jgi:phosphomannomutase
MKEYKKEDGKVVVTFSVTDKMKTLAEYYGLDFEVTKIGFKYIAEIMTHTDLLVGGEESGGLAVKGHIPERDGIWMGLLVLEFMAKTGKSLIELLEEIYAIVGPFEYDRDDLHLAESKKQEIIEKCKAGSITAIGSYPIIDTEDIDGYRFILDEGKWVMIRPSGTEPVLRVYAQGSTHEEVRSILDATHKSLLN